MASGLAAILIQELPVEYENLPSTRRVIEGVCKTSRPTLALTWDGRHSPVLAIPTLHYFQLLVRF